MHFILTIVLTAALMLGITAPISQAMDLPQEVKNIVKRGQLRVGVKTDVPGFSVQDLSGNFQGMEVDIAKKLAMRMGLRACLETHLSIMKRFNSMLAMAI